MSKVFNRERLIAEEVVKILVHFDGYATVSDIIEVFPRHFALTPMDRTPSESRPGEEKWEQIVRNIVSHRTCAGNFIHDGLLHYIDGYLCLPGYEPNNAQLLLFA